MFDRISIVNRSTFDVETLNNLIGNKKCIIDFWTTQCDQCPSALDELNYLADQKAYENVKCIAICCDDIDELLTGPGALPDVSRWPNLSHHMIGKESLSRMKRLGLKRVPYYVVTDEGEGRIYPLQPERDVVLQSERDMVPCTL